MSDISIDIPFLPSVADNIFEGILHHDNNEQYTLMMIHEQNVFKEKVSVSRKKYYLPKYRES